MGGTHRVVAAPDADVEFRERFAPGREGPIPARERRDEFAVIARERLARRTLQLAEVDLAPVGVGHRGEVERDADDRGGLGGAGQRARVERGEAPPRQTRRDGRGLLAAADVQRDVRVALHAPGAVPVGLPVADEDEAGRRRHAVMLAHDVLVSEIPR
jgi:hypothetical protein